MIVGGTYLKPVPMLTLKTGFHSCCQASKQLIGLSSELHSGSLVRGTVSAAFGEAESYANWHYLGINLSAKNKINPKIIYQTITQNVQGRFYPKSHHNKVNYKSCQKRKQFSFPVHSYNINVVNVSDC